jgi:phosphoserine aminotransferase
MNQAADLSTILMDNTEEFSYFYYCANETVHGVELPCIPETYGLPLSIIQILCFY